MKTLKCQKYLIRGLNAEKLLWLDNCVYKIFITSIFQPGIREFCTEYRE
jgi:hypothetical protein